MALTGCQGRDKVPTLEVKTCPQCGAQVEIFSTDTEVTCDKCGFTIYNDPQSCVQWCKYAKLCVGDELYRKLRGAAEKAAEQEAELAARKAEQADDAQKGQVEQLELRRAS